MFNTTSIVLDIHIAVISYGNSFLDSFSKLSLGDAKAYYLSTAKNELGVISAE